MPVELTEEVKQYLSAVVKQEVKTTSAGIEIIDLESTAKFGVGDLIMMRKSAEGKDKKIVYDDLLNSFGNTAVDGFTAVAEGLNGIVLTSVNGVKINKYYDGMKISFVSPIKSTGVVQVKIGNLTYKELHAYKSTSSAVLDENDYIEAVLIGDVFYQVNNAQYVYTNDYKIVLIEPNATAGYTDIFLESAYGVAKPAYYEGMTVNFLCTEDTKGLTRISIDGLPVKDMLENSGDYIDMIYTPLYKGQIVRLIYDGQSFIKDRFRVDDPKIIIPSLPSDTQSEIPDPSLPNLPEIPVQNIFEFKVGSISGADFPTFRDAMRAIVNNPDFGSNGKGKKVTLNIMNDQSFTAGAYNHGDASSDLSWITIKGKDNKIKIIADGNNLSGHATFLSVSNGKFPSFQEGTTITFDAQNKSYAKLFQMFESEITLRSVTITAINASLNHPSIIYLGSKSKVYGYQSILQGCYFNVWIAGEDCRVSLDGCKSNYYSTYGIYMTGAGSELTIKNCDMSKEGAASPSDLNVNGNSKNRIDQIYSKAKSNVTKGVTNDSQYGTYIVTGSQDTVGS